MTASEHRPPAVAILAVPLVVALVLCYPSYSPTS